MKKLLLALLLLTGCTTSTPEPDPLLGTTWISEDGQTLEVTEETDYTANEDDSEIVIDDVTYYPEDSEKAEEITAKIELEEKKEEIYQLLAGNWTDSIVPQLSVKYVLPNTMIMTVAEGSEYTPTIHTGTFEILDDLSLHYVLDLQDADSFDDPDDVLHRHIDNERIYTDDPNVALDPDQDYYFVDENTFIISGSIYNK